MAEEKEENRTFSAPAHPAASSDTPALKAVFGNLIVSRESVPDLTGPGALLVLRNGEVRAEVTTHSLAELHANAEHCSFTSSTSDGFEIEHASAWRSGVSVNAGIAQPPKITVSFSVSDILLTKVNAPSTWTRKILELKGPNVHHPQTWAALGYVFELTSTRLTSPPAADAISAELRVGKTGATSDDWSDIRAATLELLSFVHRVQCNMVLERTYADTELISVRAIHEPGGRAATHPLIERSAVGNFMRATMTTYQSQRRIYDLQTAIAYYVRSHEEALLEAKFIFAGVAMEALKFAWALNVRKLPTDRKANGLIRAFLKPDGNWYNFGELMTLLAEHLGMTVKYTFIEDRNALFHTGQGAAARTGKVNPARILLEELTTVQDQLDALILTILGFTGVIRSYWRIHQPEQFSGGAT